MNGNRLCIYYYLTGGILMAACNKHFKRVLFILSSLFIMVFYQNCGKSVFRIESLGSNILGIQGSAQVIDVDCLSSSGCNSAAMPLPIASPIGGGNSSGVPSVNNNANSNSVKLTNGIPANFFNSQALENTNSQKLLDKYYNFVADSKELCEQSISNALGKKLNCEYSGGCGVGCGKPNSNCESANPDKWGACVIASE